MERDLPEGTVTLLLVAEKHFLRICGFGALFLQEDQVHQQADDDAEGNRTHGACNAQLPAQHAGGQHDGQHVDGRPGIEEGDGRAEARAAHIDAPEERQDGAGADREDGA